MVRSGGQVRSGDGSGPWSGQVVRSGDGSGQVTGPARGQVRQVVRPGKGSGQAGRWSGPVSKVRQAGGQTQSRGSGRQVVRPSLEGQAGRSSGPVSRVRQAGGQTQSRGSLKISKASKNLQKPLKIFKNL